MENENQTPGRLDSFVEKFLRERSQTISRRGVLAKLGKFSLGVLGVSLLPSLPLDRTFDASAQGACCAWHLCGINGFLCNPGGANGTSCPTGTSRGPTAWSKCCTNEEMCGGGGNTVTYWDCCATTSTRANEVKGQSCPNNPGAGGTWCPVGVNHYGCTYAEVGAACDNPTETPC